MGFQPEKIRQLAEGEKFGLGTMYPRVLGEELELMKVPFKIPERLGSAALAE